MTAKIFIHIGPPKTGTTALQVAVQEVDLAHAQYCGCFQPRDKNTGLSAKVLGHAHFPNAKGAPKRPEIRKEFEDALAAGNSVFISEEMLLLGDRHCQSPDRLDVLADMLRGLPTVILLTLRRPSDAIPSLYQELYLGLERKYWSDFDGFCTSRHVHCYRYKSVIRRLSQLGFENLVLLNFEALDDFPKHMAQFPELDGIQNITALQKKNAGKTGGKGKRWLPAIDAGNVLTSTLSHKRHRLIAKCRRKSSILSKMLGKQVLKERLATLSVPAEIACQLDADFSELAANVGQCTRL
ncbi:hypothetical protein KUV51_00045 [Tateyamaria omphalii]|uniref:hypothetical protein n=1 Tax=Tateyamaria omphalii TaxID=299262 RepID=UPI001C99EDCA|nr:hypothetical protein [Tateyamaria omphalii]MBY5931371.1 hypothetical protein [Tateyamaria omphalii]